MKPRIVHGPKTVAAARRLKEERSLLNSNLFLGGSPLEGDTIAMFTDRDGRVMTPHCIRRSPDGPDEWVKVPF